MALLQAMPLAAQELAAQEPIPNGSVREATLSFDGKGTGGDFVGTTRIITGTMTGGVTLADVRGHVEAPVNTLVTKNDRRDRDLNKSMESDKYPTIRFDLDRVEPKAGGSEAVLGGRLTIHGIAKEVELSATVEQRADGIRVRTDFPLNLKDYAIKRLSRFLGIFKMNEHIVVHVDVTFGVN
jgi:polyisoprenoid-binding protein YceI